ncbi:hypothetical protein Tco_0227024, partial [Tanacetum coccineum]
SNDTDDEDETKIKDKAEGDEDEEMDYTTSSLYDGVDIRLNEPADTDKGFIQEEGTDAEMTNKTEVPVISSSHSSDLASKFLNFSDIPHTDADIISLFDFASVFQFNNRVLALEKDVSKLKKDDPLKTQVTTLVDEHLDARLGATRDEFISFLSASITAKITEQVKIQLPHILPKEVSNFAPLEIQRMVTKSLEKAVLAKESSQPQSSNKVAATLIEFELKKILIDKMDKKAEKDKDKDEDTSAGSDRGLKKRKTTKDVEPTKEEPEFEVADSDMPQDQEENLGNDDEEPKGNITSKQDWFTKPKRPQEPTDPD